MIALNETDPTAAEVPFFLPLASDPINSGLTGHDFSANAITGEVQLKLPGGSSFFNVDGSWIVEKGFGRYCVQLPALECTVAGTVYIRAVIAGSAAQPYSGSEVISDLPGDMLVGGDGYFDFFLPNASDPVFGPPVMGHGFTLGEVQVRFPGAGYVNAALADISEVGLGSYRLHIHGTGAIRGKVFVYVSVSGSQRFEGYTTILGTGSSILTAPTISNITPVAGMTPGAVGAFSVFFSKARLTPIAFDVSGLLSGAQLAVTVSYQDRNEVYSARDSDGTWSWPFDLLEDNSFTPTGPGTGHVTMLPRGGWPPTLVGFKVSSAVKAVPA